MRTGMDWLLLNKRKTRGVATCTVLRVETKILTCRLAAAVGRRVGDVLLDRVILAFGPDKGTSIWLYWAR
jgi:hypothetical protein